MAVSGFFSYPFLVRGLVAAALIGLTAPTVGTFLMQRRLSLIGDGLGHVAFAGVAIGLVTGNSPIWTALAVAVAGALAVEVIRGRGRASGDTALAILFYGGIAAGLAIVSKAPGSGRSIDSFLFGSIVATTAKDVVTVAVLCVAVLAVTVGGRRMLFAVAGDEHYARAMGLPVAVVNLLIAVLAAVTVVVAMRVVGLLLVSALMIVPVATAQVVARSFATTMALSSAIGLAVSTAGVGVAYDANLPTGATIVLMAVGTFAVLAVTARLMRRVRRSPAVRSG